MRIGEEHDAVALKGGWQSAHGDGDMVDLEVVDAGSQSVDGGIGGEEGEHDTRQVAPVVA